MERCWERKVASLRKEREGREKGQKLVTRLTSGGVGFGPGPTDAKARAFSFMMQPSNIIMSEKERQGVYDYDYNNYHQYCQYLSVCQGFVTCHPCCDRWGMSFLCFSCGWGAVRYSCSGKAEGAPSLQSLNCTPGPLLPGPAASFVTKAPGYTCTSPPGSSSQLLLKHCPHPAIPHRLLSVWGSGYGEPLTRTTELGFGRVSSSPDLPFISGCPWTVHLTSQSLGHFICKQEENICLSVC